MCSDKLILLGLLPEEVWLLILNQAGNPDDFRNVINASSYFRTLQNHRRSQFLFPAVVQILSQQYKEGDFTKATYENAWNTNQILDVRSVCRTWRDGVDLAIQTNPHHSMFGLEQNSKQYQFLQANLMEESYSLESLAEIEVFAENFDTTHYISAQKNPFINRAVCIRIPDEVLPEQLKTYISACEDIFQKYGNHIWYFTISHTVYDIAFDEEGDKAIRIWIYGKIAELLELMPNLRGIKFHGNVEKGAILNVSEINMPALTHLQFLFLEGIPLPVLNGLRKSNQQVETLELDNEEHEGCSSEALQVCMENLPSVTELAIRIVEKPTSSFKVNCQLRKLHLNATGLNASWEYIFQALEIFSETLVELVLWLPQIGKHAKLKMGLNLENIKRLRIKVQYATPLNFLLPMADTLEELRVETREPSKDQDGVIKLYGFWKQPIKSNAWTLFPKLKLLGTWKKAYCWYTCTREQWIAAAEKYNKSVNKELKPDSVAESCKPV